MAKTHAALWQAAIGRMSFWDPIQLHFQTYEQSMMESLALDASWIGRKLHSCECLSMIEPGWSVWVLVLRLMGLRSPLGERSKT
jgi:hypothetical protein